MDSYQEIFNIKLHEMEQQYGKMMSRIHICQKGNQEKIYHELEQTIEEYREAALMLQKAVENSRSPAIAVLSEIQLAYFGKAEEILQKLDEYVHGELNEKMDDRREACALFGEYAIDFAVQSMRYALIAALRAMNIQPELENQ